MKKISAEIIADSKNFRGDRITTYVVTFPRIVLAELNTHRVFSRNSASSRAIPAKKMRGMVLTNLFTPIKWQRDHKGMQGTKYFDGWKVLLLNYLWKLASVLMVFLSYVLNKFGLTKQICNRLLEPFMWHTAIVTSTDFENFFALRAHDQAEIHIAKLAEVMLEQYNKSTPNKLHNGEWHIPFGDKFDKNRIISYLNLQDIYIEEEHIEMMMVKIATARCARVSYLNFEGKDDYEADVNLHNRLSKMGHWSPFEHCAAATNLDKYYGNFKGFVQYRKMFKGENKKDNRVK